MIKNILSFFPRLFSIVAVVAVYLIFCIAVSAISLYITLSVVYMFLAMAGVVPPQSHIPFVPYL